jgi:hypothetical protein
MGNCSSLSPTPAPLLKEGVVTVYIEGEKYSYRGGCTWRDYNRDYGGELWNWKTKTRIEDFNYVMQPGIMYVLRTRNESSPPRESYSDDELGITFSDWHSLGTLNTATQTWQSDKLSVPPAQTCVYEIALFRSKTMQYLPFDVRASSNLTRLDYEPKIFPEGDLTFFVRWASCSNPKTECRRLKQCFAYAWDAKRPLQSRNENGDWFFLRTKDF